VWYAYPGQTAGNEAVAGTWREPAMVGRLVEGGSQAVLQIGRTTFNDQQRVLTSTDAAGRQTRWTYAANGEDVTNVRQYVSGQPPNEVTDLLASYGSYNAAHQPGTVADAAGRTTTFTYTSLGQIQTVTNAKNQTTTYGYDTSHRLETVTGPDPDGGGPLSAPTTTYTYDEYGRVRTVTGPDGYVVTTDDDALDRPVQVTYPDGTTDKTSYDRPAVWNGETRST